MVIGAPSSQLGPESWLRQVFADQGAIRLPYSNDAKFAVRQHLLDLVSVRPFHLQGS